MWISSRKASKVWVVLPLKPGKKMHDPELWILLFKQVGQWQKLVLEPYSIYSILGMLKWWLLPGSRGALLRILGVSQLPGRGTELPRPTDGAVRCSGYRSLASMNDRVQNSRLNRNTAGAKLWTSILIKSWYYNWLYDTWKTLPRQIFYSVIETEYCN